MKLTIIAVGKLKEPYWRSAAEEYAKRLGRYATVRVVEVPDRDLSGGTERALASEADDILKALQARTKTVALEIGDRQPSSEELAEWLQAAMVEGASDLTFVIGGSAGLDPRVLERADERLALSRMTFPHQMCRVVLLEQLYRAFKIASGEPYHL